MNEEEDKCFTRGVALALAEIANGNSIESTLRACGIHTLQDLEDAEVSDFDMDRLRFVWENRS